MSCLNLALTKVITYRVLVLQKGGLGGDDDDLMDLLDGGDMKTLGERIGGNIDSGT